MNLSIVHFHSNFKGMIALGYIFDRLHMSSNFTESHGLVVNNPAPYLAGPELKYRSGE
jgi:hypothetical protein